MIWGKTGNKINKSTGKIRRAKGILAMSLAFLLSFSGIVVNAATEDEAVTVNDETGFSKIIGRVQELIEGALGVKVVEGATEGNVVSEGTKKNTKDDEDVSVTNIEPSTGIYPWQDSSQGVDNSKSENGLPDGVPTIQEMLDFEREMYEHTKVKYSDITDQIGDHNSDGTGVGHVFSMYNASHWWKYVHNNATYGYVDFVRSQGRAYGRDGQKLVVDTEYPYSYGTLDIDDDRKNVSDSGNGKKRLMGSNLRAGYEALGGNVRTYSNYKSNILPAKMDGEPAHCVKYWWKQHGSLESNQKAIYECDDGVTRYGIVLKSTMGLYIYNKEFEAGDYLDVYYTNGQVDHCIMQDSKGMESESFILHLDGSIIEQYIAGSSKYGNLLKGCMSDRAGLGILGIVKTGNLFDDPMGTGEYIPTWVNGHPGNAETVDVEEA